MVTSLDDNEKKTTNKCLSSLNWYQRNYLYAWNGARLVRDIE